MGVLESVIRLKELGQQKSQFDRNAIVSSLDTMMKQRQFSQKLQAEKSNIDADMLKSGFKFSKDTGNYEPDEGLIDKLGLNKNAGLKDILGTVGGGQFQVEGATVGGVNIKRKPTEEEIQQDIDIKARQTAANEAAKPYTDVEAGVLTKGKLLVPEIDKLISLIENKKVYEGVGVPFGASRIAAFGEKGPWQAFKRGLTAGVGREAGLLLKDIKILAFGEGGKTLSENERTTALSNIDPSYKTEEQWIEGLKQAKASLQEKVKLMSKKTQDNNTKNKIGKYTLIE